MLGDQVELGQASHCLGDETARHVGLPSDGYTLDARLLVDGPQDRNGSGSPP
jgi:hypothetical protein